MFILVFVVLFGPKKGVLTTYASCWNFQFYRLGQILINHFNRRTSRHLIDFYFKFRYQFSALTSRFTIYVLFLFWCFFFFYGETLYLITFNYSTLNDSIPSNFFFSIKSHTVFYLNLHGSYLGNTVMFYISFFTLCSFIFLLNMRYNFNYNYLKNVWIFETLIIFFLIFNFFSVLFLFLLFILTIFSKLRASLII
jgi:hypothetical protein